MRICVDCGQPTGRAPQAPRCVPCARRRRSQANKEWCRRNPERVWRRMHPDRDRARQKDYYNRNADRCIAKNRAWYERNREHARLVRREYQRRWRQAHRVVRICEAEGCGRPMMYRARRFCADCSRFYDSHRRRDRRDDGRAA